MWGVLGGRSEAEVQEEWALRAEAVLPVARSAARVRSAWVVLVARTASLVRVAWPAARAVLVVWAAVVLEMRVALVLEMLGGWKASVVRSAEAREGWDVLGVARAVRSASLEVLGVQEVLEVLRSAVAQVLWSVRAPLLPGAAGAGRSAEPPLWLKCVRSLNGCVRGV